jgi:hypothetical protein
MRSSRKGSAFGGAPVHHRQVAVYVVTEPAPVAGVYRTWDEVPRGVPGLRFHKVDSEERARAVLRGEHVGLAPGLHAFTDGEGDWGGVGVVFVEQPAAGEPVVREIGTHVFDVFTGSGIPSLASRAAVERALNEIRNILSELGALFLALRECRPGAALTVVHDYEGVGAWMQGRWKIKNAIVRDVVAACQRLIEQRRLTVAYRRQPGHAAADFDRYAYYNRRADALASAAVGRTPRAAS